MAIISDDKPLGPKKEYPIASEGVTLLVLADVEDLGIQNSELYGPKPQVRLTWVLDEKDPEGNYFVVSRTFTNSLHEKSNLYPVVTDMLGARPPVPYDLENLLGRVNLGVIKRKVATKGKHEGRTFANIVSFLSPKAGQTMAIPSDFVRGKDGGSFGKLPQQRTNGAQPQQQSRTAAPAQRPNTAPAAPVEIADEDIPF
jgi:hypothetical protein